MPGDPTTIGGGRSTRGLIGREAELQLLADAARTDGSVLIAGEAGVGKSLLARAVADLLAEEGFTIARCAGIAGLGSMPLAALAHLLPSDLVADDSTSPARVAKSAVDALISLAPGSGAVLCIDDAPLLDPLSLSVVQQARDLGRLRVIATARTSTSWPDAVGQLARPTGLRLDLQRFSRAESGVLATRILGGPLDTGSVARVFRATDGLPLAVDELVRCALARGAFECVAGIWRWRAGAEIDERLASLLGLRVEDLAGAERDALTLVVLADSLPGDVVLAVAGSCDIASMSERRLLRAGDRPGWLIPGHPLLSVAVTERTDPVRRGALLGRLFEHLAAREDEDPSLQRRLVLAAVALDLPIADAALVDVVRWARATNAVREHGPLLERAWRQVPTAFTGLALADQLAATGDPHRAEQVYRACGPLATDEHQRVAVALQHASCLRHGLGHLAEGASVLDEVRASTSDPILLLEVAAVEAEDLLLLGRNADVIDMWREAIAFDRRSAPVYRLTQSAAAAFCYAGLVEEAEQVMVVHRDLSPVHGDAHPLVREFTEPRWCSTAILAGAGNLVRASVERRHEAALAADDALMAPVWSLPLSMDAWLRGDLVRCELLAREAMGFPVDEVRQIAQYMLLRVLQLMRREGELLPMCDEALASAAPAVAIDLSWITSARAQALASRGAAAEAVEVMFDGATRTMAMGQHVPAAFFLHDVFRVEGAKRVLGPLADLAAACDAPSISVMHAHALGVAEQDVSGLAAAAAAAREHGLGTFSRLMLDDAIAIARRRNRGGDASACALAWREVAATQTGWPDVDGGDPADALGLSPRELEVARLAAAGHTDGEIAAQLFVSVRTVNAQLRSVYRKLGVDGRRALRSVTALR